MKDVKRMWMITDTHWGARANSVEWLNIIKDYHNNIFIPLLKKHGKPGDVVVHLGDVFDNRQTLNLFVGNEAINTFTKISEIMPFHIIVGNHDIYRKNTNEITSLEFVKNIPNIKVLKDAEVMNWSGKKILLMPWQKNKQAEIETLAANSSAEIVCCHSEVAGVQLNHGVNQKVLDGVPISNYRHFKRVFTGHIHHRKSYGNVNVLGCPYQITRSDSKNTKGVHCYDIEKDDLTFYENTHSPRFVKIPLDKVLEFKLGDLKKSIENNFVDFYVPTDIAQKYNISFFLEELQGVSRTIDTIVYDEEDYLNLNIYDMKDYSGSPVDIMNLVEEYINDRNYDKKVKNRIITEVMELYNKCSKV